MKFLRAVTVFVNIFILLANPILILAAPLATHPANPRYFTDDSGQPIYVTGSQTWYNIHQNATIETNTTTSEYFEGYLDWMQSHGHNFTRLWTGLSYLDNPPFPWSRPGPGTADDGNPQFDMRIFNQSYFDAVKERVSQIQSRGMYCSIMFFGSHNGLKSDFINTAWHPNNNVNAELDIFDNNGYLFFTTDPEALETQRALVRKFIDELNDFDNLIWEIMNEPGEQSVEWQEGMIEYVRSYEFSKPKQHLIGMTGGWNLGTQMLESSAEWISPDWDWYVEGPGDYREGGPADFSEKVIMNDTDHLWGWSEPENAEEMRKWVWKTFARGNNSIFMDSYDHYREDVENYGEINHDWDLLRDTMGYTVDYSRKFTDLAALMPSDSSTECSTTYCLQNPGMEYFVYQPSSGEFTVNLEPGSYNYEWFNPQEGSVLQTGSRIVSGGNASFTPPFNGDAVLYLKIVVSTPTPVSSPTPQPTPTGEKLTGTIIGVCEPYQDNPDTSYEAAVDGNTETFSDCVGNEMYVGYDFGAGNNKIINNIRYWPRDDWNERMLGRTFEGSQDNISWVTLFTVQSAPPYDQFTTIAIDDNTPLRFARYNGAGGYLNVSEIEFYGIDASLDGDLNSDGVVNIFDLVIIGSCFGQEAVGDCARADANGNGVVDIFDLVIVGGNFGTS